MVEDAEVLGALHVASWRETYADLLPAAILAALSVEDRTAMWRKMLETPAHFGCVAIFIIEADGLAVGFGACGTQRDQTLADAGFSGEIGAIYVLRAYQAQGAGRSLMAAMSQALRTAGHEAASLWVLRQNLPARRFYEKLGGVIVGEKADVQSDRILIEDAYGWRNL